MQIVLLILAVAVWLLAIAMWFHDRQQREMVKNSFLLTDTLLRVYELQLIRRVEILEDAKESAIENEDYEAARELSTESEKRMQVLKKISSIINGKIN